MGSPLARHHRRSVDTSGACEGGSSGGGYEHRRRPPRMRRNSPKGEAMRLARIRRRDRLSQGVDMTNSPTSPNFPA